MYYFIVLHSDNSIEENLISTLSLYPHIITYEKTQSNPHYHIVLKTDKTTNYISNMLRQKFTDNRPKSVSCKSVKDLAKSIVYIIKDLDIRSNTLLAPLELEQYKIQTVAINIDKHQKRTTTTFTQQCVQTWKEKGYGTWEPKIKELIVDHIFEQCDTKTSPFDSFLVRRIYYAIVNRYYGKIALRRIYEESQMW